MQVYFKKIDDSHYCLAMPLRDVLGELLVAGIMAFAACFLVLFMLQGVRKAWPQISLGYMEALSVAVGLAVFGILRFRNIAVVCINTEAPPWRSDKSGHTASSPISRSTRCARFPLQRSDGKEPFGTGC